MFVISCRHDTAREFVISRRPLPRWLFVALLMIGNMLQASAETRGDRGRQDRRHVVLGSDAVLAEEIAGGAVASDCVTLQVIPRRSNRTNPCTGAFNGNTAILDVNDCAIEFDVFFSNLSCFGPLNTWQVLFSPFPSGLLPAVFDSCTSDAECVALGYVEADPRFSSQCDSFAGTCQAAVQEVAANHTDPLYGEVTACGGNPFILCGSDFLTPVTWDDAPHYAMTVHTNVEPDASGVITLSPNQDVNNTFVIGSLNQHVPVGKFVDAVIEIPVGRCCLPPCLEGAPCSCAPDVTKGECDALGGAFEADQLCPQEGGAPCQLICCNPGDDVCHGGSNDGGSCTTDGDCTGGVCGLKSRYISVTLPDMSDALSVQVTVASMPIDPLREGEVWWAGPSQSIANDPYAPLTGATLLCEPTPSHAEVWPAGQLHLFGSAIVPGATYEVRLCDPAGSNCSGPLVIGTGKWGDVIAPFGGETQPDFADIVAIVSKLQRKPGSPDMTRADLVGLGGIDSPNTANQVANFADINADIGAFQGQVYPYPVGACP